VGRKLLEKLGQELTLLSIHYIGVEKQLGFYDVRVAVHYQYI
jgi:hypothetical protein